jgi:protein SCO1
MIRTPVALIPYLFAAAFMAAGFLWHQGDLAGAPQSGHAAIGGPFVLTDQDGKTRSDRDFRSQWVLLYFGYSFCPDVCPTTLARMADALDKLGPLAGRVTPLFVTVDPGHDTPKVLKAYLASFGPRFVGLTGALPAITKTAHEYRVYFAKHPIDGGGYAIDHSSTIYLIGPNGEFVTYYDEDTQPDAIAADLRQRL